MADNVKLTANRFSGEPYRATRLWLTAVALFRQGVPLGKHRKQWKSYENCFVAQDSISWFHTCLRNEFDDAITRNQVVQLLQKFYKAGIFVDVSSSNRRHTTSSASDLFLFGNRAIKETDFKDNNQLYKLVGEEKSEHSSPINNSSTTTTNNSSLTKLKKRFSFTSSSSGIGKISSSPNIKSPLMKYTSKYNIIIQALSPEQTYQIWKQIFLKRFVQVIGCDVVHAFPDENIINGKWISHNLTKLGRFGVVLLDSESRKDDIPAWLSSAMKCLSAWPNSPEDEGILHHANYPGFENDVFKLITDYFKTLQSTPLLTYELYDPFIMTFIRAELFDFNSRLYSSKTNGGNIVSGGNVSKNLNNSSSSMLALSSQMPSTRVFRFEDEKYPFSASDSVENLLIDILTPRTRKEEEQRYISRETLHLPPPINIKPKRIFSDEAMSMNDEILVENVLEEAYQHQEPSLHDSLSLLEPMPQISTKYACPYFFETAFTQGSPITRVVSKTELKTSFGGTLPHNKSNSNGNKIYPNSSPITSKFAYENAALKLSAADIINHPKYSRVLSATNKLNYATASTDQLNPSISFYGDSSSSSSCIMSNKSRKSSIKSISPEEGSFMRVNIPVRSYSAANLSDTVRDRSPYVPSGSLWIGNHGRERARYRGRKGFGEKSVANASVNHSSMSRGVMSQYANSPSSSARKTLEFYYGADACVPGLMTQEGKQLAILSFRLLTLLLPPANRRHLQLLLRCMSKVAKNEKLMLDVATTNRAIVINTFFKHILSADDAEFDELLALRIVTFMMDNDAEIFDVRDETLVQEVQEMLAEQQIKKIPVQDDPSTTIQVEKTSSVNEKENTVTLLRAKKIRDSRKELAKSMPTIDSIQHHPNYSVSSIENDSENKENSEAQAAIYCKRITMNEYQSQRLLGDGGTSKSLRCLLDTLTDNTTMQMEEKERRKRLKQFRDEYPHIFMEKFGHKDVETLFLNSSFDVKEQDKTATKQKRRPFKLLKSLGF